MLPVARAGGPDEIPVVPTARVVPTASLQLLQCAQARAHRGTRSLGFRLRGVGNALQSSSVAFGVARRTIHGATGPAAEVGIRAARHLVPFVRRSTVLVLAAATRLSTTHLEATVVA